jgi:hypothetical protein
LLHGSDPIKVELNRLENEVRGKPWITHTQTHRGAIVAMSCTSRCRWNLEVQSRCPLKWEPLNVLSCLGCRLQGILTDLWWTELYTLLEFPQCALQYWLWSKL